MRTISRHRAFTLMELMLAMAVVGVLLLTCGAVMRTGGDAQLAVMRQSAMQREARKVFGQLNHDLGAAEARGWCGGSGGVGDPAGWFILGRLLDQRPSSAVGDLCAVDYQLQDVATGPDDAVVRCLVRRQHDSGEVYDALRDRDATALWSSKLRGEPLASGVICFELRPLLRDGPAAWRPWHPELSTMPDAVEVGLILASPALQQKLRTREDWDQTRIRLQRLPAQELGRYQLIIALGRHAF